MSNQSIVIEREFDAPRMLIWKAITDPDEMKKWYFDIKDFKPVVGQKFEFTGVGDDGFTQYVHLCEVKEVIEGYKLSYSWRYKGYQGNSLLIFELNTVSDQKTKLRLSHEGIDSFPSETYPVFEKKNFVTGWTYFMEKGLKNYLSNQQ